MRKQKGGEALLYKEKIIISGDILEIYEYERYQGIGGVKLKPSGRAQDASDEDKLTNRLVVYQRAKNTLRRLVNANEGQWKDERGQPYKPKFFTLTFAENITRPKDANKEWTKFIKRLTYRIGYKPQYVVVVEFQDRGAVHYHSIFFNLPFIKKKELSLIWGQGFIKINAIDEVDNVGSYVCKYMGKNLDEDKLRGEKCYFSSRGLLKPKELKEKSQVDCVRSALPDRLMKYQNSYQNDYTGKVSYKQYNLKVVKNIHLLRSTFDQKDDQLCDRMEQPGNY